MSDQSPSQPEPYSADDRRLVAEFMGVTFEAAGEIPEGHEGPYRPSQKEIVDGVRRAAQDNVRLTELQADLAIELAERMRFDESEEEPT